MVALDKNQIKTNSFVWGGKCLKINVKVNFFFSKNDFVWNSLLLSEISSWSLAKENLFKINCTYTDYHW